MVPNGFSTVTLFITMFTLMSSYERVYATEHNHCTSSGTLPVIHVSPFVSNGNSNNSEDNSRNNSDENSNDNSDERPIKFDHIDIQLSKSSTPSIQKMKKKRRMFKLAIALVLFTILIIVFLIFVIFVILTRNELSIDSQKIIVCSTILAIIATILFGLTVRGELSESTDNTNEKSNNPEISLV